MQARAANEPVVLVLLHAPGGQLAGARTGKQDLREQLDRAPLVAMGQ